MVKQENSRIIGAFIIGFAVMAGSYVVNSMSKPSVTQSSTAGANLLVTNISDISPRTYIGVVDSNQDGIEDWQEDFLSAQPIIFNSAAEYTPPDTLTGETGIAYIQSTLLARSYGPFGRSQDEIINSTISNVTKEAASDKIYNIRDVTVSNDISGPAIKAYGNALALAIINNNNDSIESEMVILRKIINAGQATPEHISHLKGMAKLYSDTKKATLAIPVPRIFVKEHLDIINVYNAMEANMEGFAKINDDPIVSLMRVKRYEDDILGLNLAYTNIYKALEPHAQHFTVEDPAVIFVAFSSEFN